MRRILTSTLVASLLCLPAFAEAPHYKLIKEKSSLKFYAIQNGAPLQGEFKEFTADIDFSADKPQDSKVSVTVDTKSVSASYGEVEQNLKLPDWLSVEKFPKATFKAEKFIRIPSTDSYNTEGKLTLRGKTIPVTLNFKMEYVDDKSAIAKGYATLKRNDFGVGQGQWGKEDVIKNEVRVEFRIAAEKQ